MDFSVVTSIPSSSKLAWSAAEVSGINFFSLSILVNMASTIPRLLFAKLHRVDADGDDAGDGGGGGGGVDGGEDWLAPIIILLFYVSISIYL
jgi:hypothetical protein